MPVVGVGGDVAGGPEDSELVRRRWAEVLGTLERRRVTWAMVSQSAQVVTVEAGVLRLSFDTPALAARFATGDHGENVALAVRETLGLHVRVEALGSTPGPVAHTAVSASVAAATGMTPVVTEKAKPAATSGGSNRATRASEPPLPSEPPPWDVEPDISDDDARADDAELSGADAIAKMLGGTVVDS